MEVEEAFLENSYMKKNEIVRISITNYSNDGSGVGRYDGIAVFVPFTAVGDEIMAKIVKVQKNYAYAIIDSIIIPSPARIDVDCPCFGKCGGCNFRHISYEEELRAKQQFVVDALRRIGDVNIEVQTIIGSPSVDRYRNKVQFPVSSSGNRMYPAFYQPRSHRPLDTSGSCKLQPELMNLIATDVCDVLSEIGEDSYNEETRMGNIRHLLIRKSSIDDSVLLCIICRTGKIKNENQFIKRISALHPQITSIVLNKNATTGNEIISDEYRVIFGPGYIKDSVAGVPVSITYDSFYQINQESTENLYRCVKDFAAVKENEVLIDLYCGSGTIGLSSCDASIHLYGVDVVEKSIRSAEEAALKMNYQNAQFVLGDSSYLEEMLNKEIRPDVIITDPPRKGCSPAVINSILASKADRIVMVSCNPATLARDLKLLIEGEYSVIKAQPVDMFPRTKHVETVVLMTKN